MDVGLSTGLGLARRLPFVIAGAAVLLFAVLKLYSLHPVIPGDEHLYFNMAVLVNQGLLPYRDFFYTHPPLHLYIAVLAFRLFGYSLVVGKLLPNLAMLLAGVLVFDLGRRTLGAAEAAVACALFLLSFDPLRISSHFTGSNQAFLLTVAGLWLAYLDRPILAGVAFGLGTLVAVYVLPGAAAVALLLWWRSRGRMLRFVAVLAALAVAGNALFYVLVGWSYVYQVYVTQMQKGPEAGLIGYTLWDRLGFISYENRLLTAGALAGLALLVVEVRNRLRTTVRRWSVRDLLSGQLRPWEDARCESLLLFVIWLAIYWLFYVSIRLLHAYYFIFVMPVFAWLSAHAYLEIGRRLARALSAGSARRGAAASRAERRANRLRSAAAAPASRSEILIPAVVAVLLTVASIGVVEALYVPFNLRRNGTQIGHYLWHPIPFLRPLDPLVRGAFWDAQYDPRHPPSGIARYLQHESIYLTAAEQLYAAVRQHSAPSDTIFGEVGVVPLVASETGRRIAANLIDTSTYRISYGLSRIEDWIAAIEADHVQLLVVRFGLAPMRYPEFYRYAMENFVTVAQVRDPMFGVFTIMTRRPAGQKP